MAYTTTFVQMNPVTGAMEPIVLHDQPSLFCDRCSRDFDEHSNLPIHSSVCSHSICSGCLDEIAQKNPDSELGCPLDCHNCKATNAFHTENRNVNVLACAALDIIRRREDYWDELLKLWQEKVESLESLLKSPSKAPGKETTATVDSNDKIRSNTFANVEGKASPEGTSAGLPTKLKEPASAAQLTHKYSNDRAEADNKQEPLLKPPKVARLPRVVWVNDRGTRRPASLLLVDGSIAAVRWEGTSERTVVSMDNVSEFLQGNGEEEDSELSPGPRNRQKSEDDRKTPLNDGEVSPFRISIKPEPPTTLFTLASKLDKEADQPTRRGRRRPRKNSTPSVPETERGPKKHISDQQCLKDQHVIVKRMPGRPRKHPQLAPSPQADGASPPRKRGRPPKNQPPVVEPLSPPPKKRGRPPKSKSSCKPAPEPVETPKKRGPGRPRKHPLPPQSSKADVSCPPSKGGRPAKNR